MNGEKFWEKTYQKNIAKMIGICYRYVADRQVAEDLAHDAFLRAIERVDTFKGLGNFDGWLMKITVNTALSYLRTQKSNVFQEDLDADFQKIADDANDESNIIQETDFSQEELLEAIHQLPEHHRTVFNLYVLENFSHEQIAKALEITVGTSKSHLARARKKLQKYYRKKQNKTKKNVKCCYCFYFLANRRRWIICIKQNFRVFQYSRWVHLLCAVFLGLPCRNPV